jgi:hypothetical protein
VLEQVEDPHRRAGVAAGGLGFPRKPQLEPAARRLVVWRKKAAALGLGLRVGWVVWWIDEAVGRGYIYRWRAGRGTGLAGIGFRARRIGRDRP